MKEKKRKIDIFNLPDDMTASEMKEAEAQFKECRALVNKVGALIEEKKAEKNLKWATIIVHFNTADYNSTDVRNGLTSALGRTFKNPECASSCTDPISKKVGLVIISIDLIEGEMFDKQLAEQIIMDRFPKVLEIKIEEDDLNQ